MQKNFAIWKKHWFLAVSLLIVILSAILRFYNYSNRWILGGDQAHFALLARYSLSSLQLPFLGPFSSAGPFQTGGEWYWFVMLGSIWNLHQVITPWIFLTLTYVGFVAGMIVLGKMLLSKTFGLILGILTAVSTAEIGQSVNLSNQSPINILSLLAIFCSIYYVRTKKVRWMFFLSLCIGLASAIHLQGVALVPLLLLTFVLSRFNWKNLVVIPLGILIPWLPVFWIDAHNHFVNIHNMVYYYFFEKNKPSFDVLGRSWKTFIKNFIPMSWSSIIGGSLLNGYILFILSVTLSIFAYMKKQLSKELIIIFLTIPCMFTILRYTRTPLFDSFYVFLHPFLLIITGWVIFFLYKKNKIVGCLLLLLILVPTFISDRVLLTKDTINGNPTRATAQKILLQKKYPGKKFAIYDYQFKTSAFSQSLSLFLSADDAINDKGMKIGYVEGSSVAHVSEYPVISDRREQYLMLDLSSISQAQLKSEDWVLVTPSGIYNSVQNWYKNK